MLQLLLAILRRQATSPLVWLALCVAGLAWPLALLLSPLSSTLTDGRAEGLSYEVSFVFLLLAGVFASRQLERHRWLLARQGEGARLLFELVAHTVFAAPPALVALLPPALLGGQLDPLAALATPVIALHQAALYALLSRLSFSSLARSVTVPFLALAIPASVSGEPHPLSFLWQLLDPRACGDLLGLNWFFFGSQLACIAVVCLLASSLSPRIAR